ncbi:MAG: hypothetical protein ABI851_01770 [Saprospiraceae bacterium]
MSQISVLAIFIGTACYVVIYYLLFSKIFLGSSISISSNTDKNVQNPVSSDKLLLVLLVGLVYSFFLNLFMIMAERSGMADGIKTSFMLTLTNFCIPVAIYFKFNGISWNKYFKTIVLFLIIHVVTGGLIGLMAQ